MNIRNLGHLVDEAEAYSQGAVDISVLAQTLEERIDWLVELFYMNDISEANGEVCCGVQAQDIINIIVLYYAMSGHKKFLHTVITR